jgi:hypothetical protein
MIGTSAERDREARPRKVDSGSGRSGSVSDLAAAGFVIVTFAVSRSLFLLAGGVFDATPLPWFCQFLDVGLLRDRLLESLVYLHAQPPLFNLYLGLVLKVAGGAEAQLFHVLQTAAGLALALFLLAFLRGLGASPAWAALTSALFVASPPSILYESWLFYELPVALLLLVAAFCLNRYLEVMATGWGVLFFTAIAAVTWTRSLFHVAWFVIVVAALALETRRPGPVLRAASAPLALSLGLCAKNALLFGFFGTSSWLGMNISRGTTFALPAQERETMILRGELSFLARHSTSPAFPQLGELPEREASPRTGIPALDQTTRTGGESNYNHSAWIGISRGYQHDALAVLVRHPETLGLSFGEALILYFRPSCDYPLFLPVNRRALAAWEAIHDRVLLLTAGVSWTIVFLHAAALFWGAFVLAGRGPVVSQAERALILFAWLTLAWVLSVGNLLEVGENSRFRWAVDPMAIGLVMHAFRHRFGTRLTAPVDR